MTEEDWLTATNPRPMLKYLRGRASDRKLRLFMVACCRWIWPLLADDPRREAVETAERYADGLAGADELDAIREAVTEGVAVETLLGDAGAGLPVVAGLPVMAVVWACQRAEVYNRRREPGDRLPPDAFARTTADFARAADSCRTRGPVGRPGRRSARRARRQGEAQAKLFRCLLGNPFRPLPARRFPPHVVALARSIDEGETNLHPLLADALADLGEESAAEHCRQPRHFRGCHVVDWALGRGQGV